MNLKLNSDARNLEECKDEVKSELDSHSDSNSEPCEKSEANGDDASEIMLKKTSSQSQTENAEESPTSDKANTK